MYAPLLNWGESQGKGPIRQKDNTLHLSLAYVFLMAWDLVISFSPLSQFIHKATSDRRLNMEAHEVPIVLNF